MANINPYLRGQAGDDPLQNLLNSDRILQENESGVAGSSTKENDYFLLLTTFLVVLILVFYSFCMYQFIRVWFCRICCGIEPEEPFPTAIIQEGGRFNLYGIQRRAILEAIFSETSKPATEHDVSQKKRRKTSGNVKDVDLPSNVEIPGISTSEFDNSVDGNSPPCPILHLNSGSETDDATDDDALSAEVDIACNITGGEGGECDSDGSLRLRTSSSFVAESMDVMKNVARTPPEGTTVFENVTPSPNETPETSAAWPGNSAGVAPVNLNLAIPDLHDVRRSLPFQDEASATDGPSGNPAPLPRSIPTLSSGFTHAAAIPVPPELKTFDFEECKQELEDLNERGANNEDFEFSSELFDDDDDADGPAALRLPIPLVRRESFTTVASEYTYDDDSTVDHACSICLGGYRKGDMLSASKYCPHIFHKDCILQWLERRDECPCCRVKMITENEMNIAATSLVGKTRMVRAVAAYQSASPPGLSVPGVSGHASPFSGTVRRSAQQRD